jgi:hypothetical protein
MVHDTPARRSARKLKTEAQVLVAEALVLAEIAGMEQEARAREARAAGLRKQAGELFGKAGLEDLTVRQEPVVKRTKKGERQEYLRWWRAGVRVDDIARCTWGAAGSFPARMHSGRPGG